MVNKVLVGSIVQLDFVVIIMGCNGGVGWGRGGVYISRTILLFFMLLQ